MNPSGTPSWFSANLSVGNLMSIGTVCVGLVTTWNLTGYRLDQIEIARAARMKETDQRFAELGTKISEIPQLSFRMTAAEKALVLIDSRLDKGFTSFTDRLDRNAQSTAEGFDGVTKALSSLTTSVAVLTQRLEENGNSRKQK